MADNTIREMNLVPSQSVQEANAILIVEAIKYMQSGYKLESGQGTASVNKAGELSIVGLNKDNSIIHWDEKVSATQKGIYPNIEFETKDTAVNSAEGTVFTANADFEKRNSKMDVYTTDAQGQKNWTMNGECTQNSGGGTDCDFKLSDGSARTSGSIDEDGTSHVTVDVNTATVKRSIDLTFRAQQEVATYSYDLAKR